MEEEVKTAKRTRKTEMVGKGCFLQGFGLLLPILLAFLGPVGIGIGIVACIALLIAGSMQSIKWTCGNCGTVLLDKKVSECPGCHAQLQK